MAKTCDTPSVRRARALGGTLCIGVANDLIRRIYEHRMGLADGFTKKYGVHRLV
jgi:putative endonuclease